MSAEGYPRPPKDVGLSKIKSKNYPPFQICDSELLLASVTTNDTVSMRNLEVLSEALSISILAASQPAENLFPVFYPGNMTNLFFLRSLNLLTTVEVQSVDMLSNQYFVLYKIIETCLNLKSLRISASKPRKLLEKKSLKNRFKLNTKAKKKKMEIYRTQHRVLCSRRYLILLSIRSEIEINAIDNLLYGPSDVKAKRHLCACLFKQKEMNILNFSSYREARFGNTALKIMDKMFYLQNKIMKDEYYRKNGYVEGETRFIHYLNQKERV